MQLAGVPVPRPKPETEEPDMALVPAEVAADSGEDEEAVAQESARVADQQGGETASRPSETPPKSLELASAPAAEPPAAEAPPPESAPQGDFGTTGLNPIDPSEDAVAVGKSDSLFVMRQAAPAPGKTITTVKPARASLAAAPTIEPASLTRGAPADLSTHSASWNIQIGAFPSSSAAQERIDAAKAAAADLLRGKIPFTMPVSRGNDTIFRARFSGFDEAQAREACKRLSRKGVGCFPLAPHG